MSGRRELYKELLPVLPPNHTQVYRDSINLVGDLPGLESWLPPTTNLIDILRIVSIGFPLTYLTNIQSINPLRRRIAKALKIGSCPAPSDLSEINAAALCVTIGASSIEQIQRASSRTPDFAVSWPNDSEMELEVTCADEKLAHKQRKELAHKLGQAIFELHLPHDIIIHFLVPPDASEIEQLIKTAYEIKIGNHLDCPGRWHIYAEKQNREPYAVYTGGQRDQTPQWWPHNTIDSNYFTGWVAGPDATEAPPQARVSFALPLDAYINPLQHKAERSQRCNEIPYIVALDVHNLPGAHREFKKLLPEYFMLWPDLSGVIIFQQFHSTDKIGWTHELLMNPFAKHPLPLELYKFYCSYQKSLDTQAVLVSEV